MENKTEIIPVQFDDGTTIQILSTMLGGMEQVGVKEGGMSFGNVTKSIKNIAGEVAKIIKDVQPNKATVSMGFDVATSEGQLTALLVKGTASASLTVTLEWEKEKPSAKTRRTRSNQNR